MERGIPREAEHIRRRPLFHPHWRFPLEGYLLRQGQSSKDADAPVHQAKAKDTDDAGKQDVLYCVKCRYPITRQSERITINEQHQHVFANPHGYIYQIGCFANAPGCAVIGDATNFFSWFPGYAWRIALCGQCLGMLGWAFQSQDSQFYGLILDNLKAAN